MLRGILATITGLVLLYASIFLISYTANNGEDIVIAADDRELTINYFYLILFLFAVLSFITGLVTRAISRGSFGWTAASFIIFLVLILVFLNFDLEGSNGYAGLFLVMLIIYFLVLLLAAYLGWRVARSRQIKKRLAQAPAGSHLH